MSAKNSKAPSSPSASKLHKFFQKPSTRDRSKSGSDHSPNPPNPSAEPVPPFFNESSAPSDDFDVPPAIPRPPRTNSPRPRTRTDRPISTASELLPSRSLHSSPSASKLSDLPTRISGWFNHTFSTSTHDLSLPSILSQSHSTGSPSSPRIKLPFLTAIPGKAVRYIFDTDATADKSTDPIWLLGIQHTGHEPSPPHQLSSLPLPSVTQTSASSSRQAQNQLTSGSPRSIQSATLSLSESSSNSSLHDIPDYIQPLGPNKLGWPPAFYADFTSRIWLTYRSNFPPIKDCRLADLGCGSSGPEGPSVKSGETDSIRAPEASPSMSRTRAWPWSSHSEKGWTADTGWGCMLRTGQSLLANVLVHLHLGRDWRRPPYSIYTVDFATYVQILTWFFDTPAPEAPFSVHRMALAGKELGKDVGQWFGPSTAAGAIKTLVLAFPECGLGVAVATDGALYQSEVYTASHGGSAHARSPKKLVKTTWGDRPVLLLLGVRLGIDRVNPIYYDTIKQLYTFPQSAGIAGGRPSSSYYFVGAQGNNLFYLDPHQARHTIPLRLPPPHLSSSHLELPADSDHERSVRSGHSHSISRSPSQRQRRQQQQSNSQSNHSRIPTSPSSIRTSSSNFSYHSPMSPSPLQQQYSTSSTTSTTSTDLSSSPGGVHSTLHSPRRMHNKSPPPVAHARFHSQMESRRRSSEVEASNGSGGGNQSSLGHASAGGLGTTGGGSSIASSLIGGLDSFQQHYATAYSFAELKTFHCDQVRKMPMSALDPSMLIGFLCRDEADWIDLKKRVGELPKAAFSIQDEPPRWPDDFEDEMGILESVSSEVDEDEEMGDEGEGERINHEEDGEDEGDGDGVKVEVELASGREDDGDVGSDEFFDTRSRSSAEGTPERLVIVSRSGVAPLGRASRSTSTRSSTEEDPVDPVTPGPGSRFSLSQLPSEKSMEKTRDSNGGDEALMDDDDDDWVDSSLMTPGPGAAQSRTVKLMSTSVLRTQSLSKSSSKGKSKTKSRHRRGEPTEADDGGQEQEQEHYLFPGAGDDDDEFLDRADQATPLDRTRNNTATPGVEDAVVVLSGRRMNNVRARDGGRTQSGGVKGILTE